MIANVPSSQGNVLRSILSLASPLSRRPGGKNCTSVQGIIDLNLPFLLWSVVLWGSLLRRRVAAVTVLSLFFSSSFYWWCYSDDNVYDCPNYKGYFFFFSVGKTFCQNLGTVPFTENHDCWSSHFLPEY